MMAKRTDFNGSNTQKRLKSPCSFQKTGCSFHSFEPILSKRAKKKSPKNLDFSGFFGGELGIRTLGTFLYTAFRVLHLRPLGQLSVYVIPHFFQKLLERTDGKNNKIFNFRTGENPEFTGFLSGANSQLFKKFRVPHLWPLGQLFVITNLQLLKCCTASQKQGGFGPPEGIRTPVLQNRNLLRYPTAPQAVT